MQLLRAFSVPKNDDLINEDRWASSADGRICSLSDGASVSYDSATWASLLVRRFVADQNLDRTWVDEAAVDYCGGRDRDALPWMQQAAFDRGSFATLLGVVCSSEGATVEVVAFGDSLMALVDGNKLKQTLVYTEATQFDQSPKLLSTDAAERRNLSDEEFAQARYRLDISMLAAPSLILATDAIGRWLLDDPTAGRVADLLAINSDQAFRTFVEQERGSGRLHRDDSTLLILGRGQ